MRTLLPMVLVTSLVACAVTPAEDDTRETGDAITAGATAGAFTTIANVNLREAPRLDAEILSVIPTGTRLVAIAKGPTDRFYNVAYGGKQGWVHGSLLRPEGGTSATPAADDGDGASSQTELEISANGRAQMKRIVAYADAHDSGVSNGRCFEYVWNYLYQSGYGTIDEYNDAPTMRSEEARNFAEYFNVKSNADRYGLQRLPLNNPYDAPVGAVVVVAAGSPGTRHPTAGDISIAAGGGRFINDGPNMGYGGSASYFASHGGRVLGIFVPK